MFKKLRIKFITTIMVLLTSIVGIVFGIIFISTKNNNENYLFSQIEKSIDFEQKAPGDNPMDGGKINNKIGDINNNNEFKKNNIEGISILYQVINEAIVYNSTYDNVNDKDIYKIVNKVMSKCNNERGKNKDRGFIEYNNNNYAYIIKNSPEGIQILLRDSSFYRESMEKLIILFIIIGLATLIVLFFISVFIARKSIKPVEEAYNSQKRFIADASHELKTPLAIIKTNIDIIKANENDTIKNQKKWFNYINFQTDRMSKLISNLLYLAKADNNEEMGKTTEFNLSDSILNQILSFEAVMYENSLQMDYNIEDGIIFNGNKEEINQLMGIFIDNAVKHSFENTCIKVEVLLRKQMVLLSVENTGETIPKEDLKKIFERFYRVDKSRERERGGYGLGLSIALSIVNKYKGNIKAESENNVTKFSVKLPINTNKK